MPVRRSIPTRVLPPALAVGLVLPLAACGQGGDPGASSSGAAQQGGTVTVTDARGSVEVPRSPQRVVAVDRVALDIMDYLGAEPVGVSQRVMPASLSTYADPKYTDVGTQQELNFEEIAALGPDLIVLGGRSATQYDEAKKIAPTLDITAAKGASTLDTLRTASTAIATVYGKEQQAADRVTQIEAQMAAVKAKAPSKGTGLVLMVSGGKLAAFGAGSRFGLIHEELGVRPAATNLSTDRHGQVVSFEFVKKANPDMLFVIDRDKAVGQKGQAAQAVLDNPLVRSTKAATNGQITYLDGQQWYALGNGLNALPGMVGEIDAALTKAATVTKPAAPIDAGGAGGGSGTATAGPSAAPTPSATGTSGAS